MLLYFPAQLPCLSLSLYISLSMDAWRDDCRSNYNSAGVNSAGVIIISLE